MLMGFLQSFWFPCYHRFSRISAWKTALFALWLLLVGMLIFNVYFIVQTNKQLPVFLKSLPTISFADGEMTAPLTKLTLAVPKTQYQIILDTTATQPPSLQTFFDDKIMLFVSKSHFYVPSVAGLQAQSIAKEWNVNLTPQWFKEKEQDIKSVLQTVFFVVSFFVMLFFFLGSFCMAAAVIFLWQGFTQKRVPLSVRLRWAVFLQGPALALFALNLFISVPLFLFAVFILFMMYSQQIYNTLPE
ncbi:MAG: DUF1189 family protein [Elusimicrobiaceae bacterium]|nr:DUF1189 family protein [Elusimicrobiaceae bacterium]